MKKNIAYYLMLNINIFFLGSNFSITKGNQNYKLKFFIGLFANSFNLKLPGIFFATKLTFRRILRIFEEW
jgi:hypothetical protein